MISTEMDSDMSKSLGINSTKRIVSLMVGDIGVVITLDVKIVSSASIGISYLIPHESRISMIGRLHLLPLLPSKCKATRYNVIVHWSNNNSVYIRINDINVSAFA